MPEIPDKNPADLISPAWPKYLFLPAVTVFLYLFLFKFPATPFFTDGDQSIFLYEGERLFNGDVMYRDFFEFTLPGTQALYAAMFAIFGLKYWIIGAVTIAIGVSTTWILLKTSEKLLAPPLSYLPAVVYVFFGFRWFGIDGSHRMFSPIFILLAIWILMRGKSSIELVLAGCSLAIASFFTQQRGFVVLTAIVVYLFLDRYFSRESWASFFRSTAVITLSFLILLIALCSYFVFAAGADNFFYATFAYPYKYYSYGHPNNFGVYFIDLKKAFAIESVSDILELAPTIFYAIALPFVNVVLLALFLKNRKHLDWQTWRFPILIGLTGFFLTLSTTAPNQFRLFQIAGPSLIVLVWLLDRIDFSWNVKRRFAHAAIGVLLLLGAFQAIRMQTHWEFVDLDFPVGKLTMVASPQAHRYQWLSKNVQPGDYFFEVYEPFVYFPLQLKNPTRYSQIWSNGYTRPEQVNEVISDLTAKRPRFILFDNGYLPSATPRGSGDHTGPLADFMLQNYTPIGEVYEIDSKPVQIWEIKPR
ncbi:MAG TPA: hypothetical protein PLP21_12595 [Pyrinomonadaceae bacterium]|nr:hypothetical protein [Acidobacteriota bacterium]HQZ97151.1 hypothetical protein [Pyrinomonadaceae bacterium]